MARRTSIAWRNLVRERTRLAISVGGVAFAVMLILIIRALYAGVTDQATEYIRSVDADVWVAQAGTPGDFFHSVSVLPVETGKHLGEVDGVRQVAPLLGRPIVFRHRGKDVDVFLVGVDPATGTGGPPAVESGRGKPRPGEVVIDRVFARNTGIAVGDRIEVRGRPLEVAGIARGGNAIVAQFAWTTFDDAALLFGAQGIANYFLVEGSAGEDPSELSGRIGREIPSVKPLTEAEFVDNNTADLREGFLPIVWVLVLIAFAIGTVVIGLTVYTATLEKRREYGVLKAIGFSNRRLVAIVWRQSLAAGVIGLLAGIALAVVAGAGLERLLPSFVTTFRPFDVGLVSVAALGMSLASSFIPVRPVTRLDPAQVFRV